MADFSATYTAKRGLTPGHVLDSLQVFNVDLAELLPFDRLTVSQNFTPTDAESSLKDVKTFYEVRTRIMNQTEMLLCREFLLSCSASELFTVSLLEAPSINAHLVKQNQLKPTRVGGLKYRFQFVIRVY